MAATITWSIPTVERNLSDGGITVIHWRCQGVDGDHSWDAVGSTSHTPDADADGFIAYDSVTEENCITWAKAQLDVDAIEASVTAGVAEMVTPTTATGQPWA